MRNSGYALWGGFCAGLGGSIVLCLKLAAMGDLRESGGLGMPFIAGLVGCYLVAAFCAVRLPSGAVLRRAIILGSVVQVLCFFGSPPSLSDDVYRYLWEGRVIRAGENPYLHPPSHEQLASLRDGRITPHINHPDMTAIYPPLAQGVFALTPVIPGLGASGNLGLFGGWRLLLLGAHGVVCLVLVQMLERRQRPIGELAIYALHPLIPLEVGSSAHLEILPLALAFLGLFALEKGHATWGLMWMLLGVGVKLVPVVLLPVVVRRVRWWKTVLGLGVLLAIAALPLLSAGWQALSSAQRFHRHFLSAPIFYRLFDFAFGQTGARLLWTLAVLALVLTLANLSERYLFHGAAAVLVALFALGPVVHPWYLLWLVPFACLLRSTALQLFAAASLFSYCMLIDFSASGAWNVPPEVYGWWMGLTGVGIAIDGRRLQACRLDSISF